MPTAETAADILREPGRLRALAETRLLDSDPEPLFNLLTALAAKTLHVPVALVSLVDAHRQFFKSAVGLPQPVAQTRETPLSHSFCQHAVVSREPLIIHDARNHPLVRDNPSICDLGVIAYAGIPLITHDGFAVGSFCVIDTRPRDWTPDEIDILHDLARAALLELELRRSVNAAVRSNAAKDNFIAALSHELRTPLNPALLTATAMLRDPALPESFREDVRRIQRNIELETRLIDDLLDSTRIASGKLRLHLETGDVHQLLAHCADICRADAQAKGIDLRLALAAPRRVIRADVTRLQQVFWNLLKNAIKFTPPGGSISISTRNDGPDNDAIAVAIADTGIGISPEFRDRMFEPFTQDHASREHGGLGLGLAICKGIVHAHGGSISAASPGAGRGATLRVWLPGAGLGPSAPAPAAPARPIPPNTRIRILVVEDHLDTLRAMQRALAQSGYDVTTAGTVAAGLQAAAAASPFDIVISDIGLPDGTGLDLIRQLAARGPVRGIALTGYGMESDIEDALRAGFSRHLTKPINFTNLHAAIEELAGA